MNYDEFVKKVKEILSVGKVFKNPGRGISTVTSVTGDNVYYQRLDANIQVSFQDLYDAYTHFKGNTCSTNDLKAFCPSVFDSKARPAGHDCNCTFLFMLLKDMGLCGDIQGEGVRGSPFWVEIF